MKKLSNKICILIIAIILLAVGGAFSFVYGYYWGTVVSLLFLIWLGFKLYRLNMRAIEHFKTFTDTIQFSENSISFRNDISEEEYITYYTSLSKALKEIDLQTQKRETYISFYKNLLNRIDFALIVANKQGKITWINKFALDLLGRPKPTRLEDIKNISVAFRKAFEDLSANSSKILKLDNKGKVRSLFLNLSKIHVRGNELMIYSLKDIQPIVEETEATAWQQLTSVLTHEIMNSLAPIISLAETLSEMENDPELTNKAIHTIYRRSKGLIDFVSNYKKLTQIPEPRQSQVNVKNLIEDVTNLIAGQHIYPKVLITSEDLAINADKGQIEQVLINLIKNAQEASMDIQDPEIKITATSNRYNQIVICITDNGHGMDTDTLNKIFTPFYTTKQTGSGIGLNICRQIITKHKGTLTATSALGKGSTFTIVM